LQQPWDDGTPQAVQSHEEMQHPWLVTPDGTVRVLPYESGVGPRGALPDGRLLLPAADPLWGDEPDEPLSGLTLHGEARPLCAGPRPGEDDARPSRLLREAFPELAPIAGSNAAGAPADGGECHADDGAAGAAWAVVDARVDEAADEVVVLLTTGGFDGVVSGDGSPLGWALVAFGPDRPGSVRGIARGTRPADAGGALEL
jgi:hypothetical protein